MIIIGCSKGKQIAKEVAKKLKKPYSKLKVKKFPDNELYVRFLTEIKGKKIVLFQSFYGNINDLLVEVIFAAYTAKELGARSVVLVAPYFPYFRQDTRFNQGECISIEVVGKIFNKCLNEIYIIDPHLHREKSLSHVFDIKAHRLSTDPLIADYIKKNIKNPLLVGPDIESYKWAEKSAKIIGCESVILRKNRISSRKVEVKINKKISLKDKNLVIVDDMISTGHTLLQTIKGLKKFKPKAIYCIAVHGIFVENALNKLRKASAKVVTSNTIPNSAVKIDVSRLIVEKLK
jgi:ribose-phosphate pyrophosphokinase